MEKTDRTHGMDGIEARVAELERMVAVLAADNERLARDNAELAREASEARAAEREALAARDRLIESLMLANQRFFGSRSERLRPDQLSLFNDFEAAADPSEPEPAPSEPAPPRPRRRGGPRVLDLSSLPATVVEHDLPEEGRACPRCGAEMGGMGFDVRRELVMVPAHLEVVEHRVRKYRCPACSAASARAEGPATIVRAPAPEPPVPGSAAGPSLIAHVLAGKYASALPLYRMEAELARLGAPVSRASMSNWALSVSERWLSRVRERMRAALLAGDVVHADETEVQVLREPDRAPRSKSRMWLFCAPACGRPNYVFEYAETRAGSVAASFLGDWRGYLCTDGYAPYFSLFPEDEGLDPDDPARRVTNVACLVHVRRKFAEIVKALGGPEAARAAGSLALEGLRLCDAAFSADAAYDGAGRDARYLGRLKTVAPALDALEEWVAAQLPQALPGMALHKALEYAAGCMPYVRNALLDGRLELSNNLAERAVRPFVLGRKNWLFSNTPRGAEASACVYSVVTTALGNDLDPRRYLQWLLEEMPNAASLDDEAVDSMLPWSPSVPDSCRLSPAAARRAEESLAEPVADPDRPLPEP